MRRSIWYAGVVMIGCAAWLYLAATYVNNFPNSYFSRCAEVAYRLGGEYNPVYRLSHAFAVRVRAGVDAVMQDHGYIRVETTKPSPACEPCIPSIEAIAAAAPFGMIEALPDLRIEVHATKPGTGGQGYHDGSEQCTSGVMKPPVSASNEAKPCDISEECTAGVITVGAFAPPASDDDTDPAPKTMPPLPPDDKSDEAPATMPYEDDDDPEGAALLEFWKSLFDEKVEKAKEAETTGEPKTMKPEEESETPETSASEKPDCDNGNCQMPASHYSSHPSCTSCPGTVTCPYTGRTYPANPDDDPKDPVVPTPTLKKKKKKKDDAGNLPGKVSKLIEMEKSTESVPVHPEVDTMEYRRADGKKGEFDPQPE